MFKLSLLILLITLLSCSNNESIDEATNIYKYKGYEKIDSAFFRVDMDLNEQNITSQWPASAINADRLFDLQNSIFNISSISVSKDSITLNMENGSTEKKPYEEFPDLLLTSDGYSFFRPSSNELRFSTCALFRYESGKIIDQTEKICENQIAVVQVSNFFNSKQLEANDSAGGYILWGRFIQE